MKKFILGFCLIAMLASCGSKNEQWEYKVVKVAGHDAEIAAISAPWCSQIRLQC